MCKALWNVQEQCNFAVQYLSNTSKRFLCTNLYLRMFLFSRLLFKGVFSYLFKPFPLVLGRKFFVCNQALQQLMQGGLGSYHLLLLRLHPADLFTKGWRCAEVCVWSCIFDLMKDTNEMLELCRSRSKGQLQVI